MQHCTQYHLYTAVSRENAFWLVQRNTDTSRLMAAWRKSGILLSQRIEKTLCKWDIHICPAGHERVKPLYSANTCMWGPGKVQCLDLTNSLLKLRVLHAGNFFGWATSSLSWPSVELQASIRIKQHRSCAGHKGVGTMRVQLHAFLTSNVVKSWSAVSRYPLN
jgi:hypothetical protein